MTRLEKLQAEFKAKMSKIKELRAVDPAELTDEQAAELRGLIPAIETLKTDIEDEKRMLEIEAADNPDADDDDNTRTDIDVEDQPVYRGNFPLGQQLRDVVRLTNPATARSIKAAAESRVLQAANRAAAMVNRADPEQRAAGDGAIEAVGSEGGFLLQSETALELITHGYNNSAILPKTTKRTLTGPVNKVKIIGIDESSRADGSRGGGIRVYTTAELEQMTETKTKFKYVTIEPKKLTGLFYASDEILEDVGFLEGEITDLFGKEFAFKAQDLMLWGTGVGEPLGIMAAAATIEQAAETQTAATVIFENVIKMRSRVYPGSRARYMWMVNADVEPQFPQMVLGTNEHPVYMPAQGISVDGYDRLFGKPIVPIEQCSTVGTPGDIIAADWSEYITADKGAISSATSIHLKFDYNQTAFRFIYRFDGQPRWTSALTPYKGTNTTSPFVTLAVRA